MMKSKVLHALLVFLATISFNLYANESKSTLELRYSLNSSTYEATVVGINDTIKSVVIPPTIIYNDSVYNVTKISERALVNGLLEFVSIPSSIITIYANAFPHSLINVRFEDGQNDLNIIEDAIILCNALTNIYVGRNINCRNCLFDCPSLESFEIGKKVTVLGDIVSNAKFNVFSVPSNIKYLDCRFSNCLFDNFIFSSSDENIKTGYRVLSSTSGGSVNNKRFVPLLDAQIDTLTISRNIVFQNITPFNSNFKTVTITNDVHSIGESAFQLCNIDSLSIEYSSETLKLSSYALNCKRISFLHINRNLSDTTTFMNKNLLRRVVIGDSLCNIPNGFFSGNRNLKHLTIGSRINHIGNDAFKDCNLIDTIVSYQLLPPKIYSNTFDSYRSTLLVPNGSLELYKNTDYWKKFYEIKEFYSVYSGIINLIADETNDEETKDEKIEVYNMNGLKLPINYRHQIPSLPNGVYIINGKKHIL